MKTRSAATAAVLAAVLFAAASVDPARATIVPVGDGRVAEQSAPRWIHKLLDYVGCVGAIVMVKDPGTALGAVAACGNAIKAWSEE